MGYFSTIHDGFNAAGQGAVWAWEHMGLKQVIGGLGAYTANTGFQVLDQVRALRTAVPALIYNEKSQKIVYSMGYMVVRDVLPLVGLNYANNSLQHYFDVLPLVGLNCANNSLHNCSDVLPLVGLNYTNNSLARNFNEEDGRDPYWAVPYAVLLTTLTLVDFGVKFYTLRQGAQSFIRITVLDSVAPPAFNADKGFQPPQSCSNTECSFVRRMKGSMREPLILLTNDALVYMISQVPYGGALTSRIARVFFNGRHISRLAIPDHCDSHRFQLLMQESVLAFGLTFELTSNLMNQALAATIGMPPYIFHRTMLHLLLLLHVNLAIHTLSSSVHTKNATIPIDPFVIYETVCRFAEEVAFSGLQTIAPKYFKIEEGVPPLITLSGALQLGTRLFKGDLDEENTLPPDLFKQRFKQFRALVFPPIIQGADGFINDPIIASYWPSLNDGVISSIGIIKNCAKDRRTKIASMGPADKVAITLYWLLGFPKALTKTLLILSNDKDFWDFVNALEDWFGRHNVRSEFHLVSNASQHVLFGDKPLVEAPTPEDVTRSPPVLSAVALLPIPKEEKPLAVELLAPTSDKDSSEIKAEDLLPVKKAGSVVETDQHRMFSTRKRLPPRHPGGKEVGFLMQN
ncbi:MAG: hypothetical protein ACHP6H_00285 [Legionellales bacterium]